MLIKSRRLGQEANEERPLLAPNYCLASLRLLCLFGES